MKLKGVVLSDISLAQKEWHMSSLTQGNSKEKKKNHMFKSEVMCLLSSSESLDM